jgi:hypothetical protein
MGGEVKEERQGSLGCRIETSSSRSRKPRAEKGANFGMGISSALSTSEAAAAGAESCHGDMPTRNGDRFITDQV